MTPFTKIEVTASGSLEYLQHLCANDIDQPIGKVIYTAMLNFKVWNNVRPDCYAAGQRKISRFYWRLDGNARSRMDETALPLGGSVSLVDANSGYCCLGLWSPRAKKIFEKLTKEVSFTIIQDIYREKYFSSETFRFLHCEFRTLAKTVGKFTPKPVMVSLCGTPWEAGKEFGLVPDVERV